MLNHLPISHQNAWVALLNLLQPLDKVVTNLYRFIRTMSPPSGKAQSLHPRPNTRLSSESELRLPEFMWVRLLRRIPSSPEPPAGFTCLPELSSQTLTGSCCCSGRWARQGATVNGDWGGEDLGERARAEGWSPFSCIFDQFRIVGFLSDASLLPVMTKGWTTVHPHSACRQTASRCAHTHLYFFHLLGYRCACVTTLAAFGHWIYLEGDSKMNRLR